VDGLAGGLPVGAAGLAVPGTAGTDNRATGSAGTNLGGTSSDDFPTGSADVQLPLGGTTDLSNLPSTLPDGSQAAGGLPGTASGTDRGLSTTGIPDLDDPSLPGFAAQPAAVTGSGLSDLSAGQFGPDTLAPSGSGTSGLDLGSLTGLTGGGDGAALSGPFGPGANTGAASGAGLATGQAIGSLGAGNSGQGVVSPAGAGSAGAAGTGGMPFLPPMGGMGGGGGQEKDRERSTWLAEEEAVWGTDPDCAPAVLGRDGVLEPDLADHDGWEPVETPATEPQPAPARQTVQQQAR
jgi:hypothetical protein